MIEGMIRQLVDQIVSPTLPVDIASPGLPGPRAVYRHVDNDDAVIFAGETVMFNGEAAVW